MFFGTSAAEINKALTIPGYFDPWSSKNRLAGTGVALPVPRSVGDRNHKPIEPTPGRYVKAKATA